MSTTAHFTRYVGVAPGTTDIQLGNAGVSNYIDYDDNINCPPDSSGQEMTGDFSPGAIAAQQAAVDAAAASPCCGQHNIESIYGTGSELKGALGDTGTSSALFGLALVAGAAMAFLVLRKKARR